MKKNNKRIEWIFDGDRPDCIICGNPVRPHTHENGFVKYWRKYCNYCHKNTSQEQYKYRLHKKEYCERCGFIAEHPSQLDIDHIDGNHKNNDMNNLQTLCANCHRLKTLRGGEHNGEKYIPATEIQQL